jgi:hypothetical protein
VHLEVSASADHAAFDEFPGFGGHSESRQNRAFQKFWIISRSWYSFDDPDGIWIH